jgi:hypothetical protein
MKVNSGYKLLVFAIFLLISGGGHGLSSTNSTPSLSAKLNYNWFTTFSSVALKLASTVVDGVCLNLNKTITKTVWIYNVNIQIKDVCLNEINFDRLGDDFYQPIDVKGNQSFLNNQKPINML